MPDLNLSEENRKKLEALIGQQPSMALPYGGLSGDALQQAANLTAPPAPMPEMPAEQPLSVAPPVAPKQSPAPSQDLMDKIKAISSSPSVNTSDSIKTLLSGQDKDIKDAQQKQENLQLIAMLNKAGNEIGSGLAGVKTNEESYAPLFKLAQQPIQQLKDVQDIKQKNIKTAEVTQQLTNDTAKNDPKSDISIAGRELAKEVSKTAGLNIPIPDNISLANLEKLMPGIEGMANRRIQMQAIQSGKEDKKADKDSIRVQKAGEALGKDVDPTGFRAGTLRDNQKRLDAAGRIEALYDAAGGNPNNIQMRELATSVAGMLTNGSTTAVSQINELVPSTMRGKAAEIQQWLTNKATPLQQQNFAQMYLHIAQREKQVAQEQLLKAQLKKANQTHKWLKDNAPQEYYSRLSAATGIGDLDELKSAEEKLLSGKGKSNDDYGAKEPAIKAFMDSNGIKDRDEAIKILKEAGKL